MQWLSVHMIMHILEMFYLPPLLIVGAPWVPLLFALPVDTRRRLLCAYYQSRSIGWFRGVSSVLASPIAAVVLFNAVMVFWHIPVIFDWASWHGWVMNWLMAPSFVLVGLLFWRVILPSHPWPARGSTRLQIAAIIATAFEMLVLAMTMSIFTKGPWYSMNVMMDGPAAALRDQRWAAGILWVCGDFWAVPALVLITMRISSTAGGVSASFERVLGRT
jgi:cytochrome c oxidase assembly factor CtaG